MRNIRKGCTLATGILSAVNASAGGLWLNEFGDFAGGRAAAGAAAGVDDAMTIAYNPASITRLEGNQLFVSGGAIVGDMNFDISYTNPRHGYDDGGNAGETAVFSSMAYVPDLHSDKWSLGVALIPLSGAGIDYGDEWVGRFQATKVELQILALSPTVAYQVTDRLSLGASVQAYYADLKIDTVVPRLDPSKPEGKAEIRGNDVNPAFTLGAMYELSDASRFGLFYQSELKPKFNGDLKTTPLNRDIATDTELTLAEYVRFSVHQDLDEHWGVDFTVGWDNWSALGSVLLSTEDRGVHIPANWEDTYHYAWGAQYKLDKYWAFTGGVAYDSNPVDSEYRNAQLPIDRQIRYAVGAQYQLQESLVLD